MGTVRGRKGVQRLEHSNAFSIDSFFSGTPNSTPKKRAAWIYRQHRHEPGLCTLSIKQISPVATLRPHSHLASTKIKPCCAASACVPSSVRLNLQVETAKTCMSLACRTCLSNKYHYGTEYSNYEYRCVSIFVGNLTIFINSEGD